MSFWLHPLAPLGRDGDVGGSFRKTQHGRGGFRNRLGVFYVGLLHFLIPAAAVSFRRLLPAPVLSLGTIRISAFVWVMTWGGGGEFRETQQEMGGFLDKLGLL